MRRALGAGTLMAAMVLTATAATQDVDPVLGTWILGPARSSFNPGPPLRSQTRTGTQTARGVAFTLTGTSAAGAPMRVEYPGSESAWPDTFTARLEALALMQTLNADILASRSSTMTLEGWCDTHALASPARIVADAVAGAAVTPSAEQLQRLEVASAGEVKYRHVRLRCGTHVLSEADNWYVPARLTPEMNRVLDTTDAPFGRVVAPLQPYRRTFSMTVLWSPLPSGWEHGERSTAGAAGRPLDIPAALFEHRAVLYTRENRPFSEVRETYQRGILEFPPPPR